MELIRMTEADRGIIQRGSWECVVNWLQVGGSVGAAFGFHATNNN